MPKTAFTQADVDTWNRADKHQITVNNRDIAAQRLKLEGIRSSMRSKGIQPNTPDYQKETDPILLDIGYTEWLNTRIQERIDSRKPAGVKAAKANPFRN